MCPALLLRSALLPDKAFKGGRLRVYAEWHPTSFLLLQDELVDDLCERRDDRQSSRDLRRDSYSLLGSFECHFDHMPTGVSD